MAISTAVPAGSISRTSGYQLNKGNFSTGTPYLPQKVVILGEANTANQSTLVNDSVQITTAAQAGQKYGYGSPIHQIARILFPVSGTGISVPVYVMAQDEPGGATATVIVITITGTATANKTHYINIAGRESLDFSTYAVNIVTGDTPTVIAAKYVTAINAVLGAPVTASSALGVLTLTAKWKGATGAGLTGIPDVDGNTAGVTYVVTSNTAGTGSPSIAAALALFEDEWNTLVINSYGTVTLTDLEDFNGIPDNDNPTGRYAPMVWKPILAFFGSTLATTSALIAITDADARVQNVTNVLCPAPGSAGMPYEAAANMVLLFANVAQSKPHLTVAGQSYPDMPIPESNTIGEMSIYANRDALRKAGCSTVTLKDGAYKVQDLVTTYHPDGEIPLIFSEARYLVIDWNVKYGYGRLEDLYLKDKTIVADGQYTSVQDVIKPADWKSVLFTYFDALAELGLINDPEFSRDSVVIEIDPTNPNRFNTTFSYKRTGTTEIESTTVTVGF
jgi:phage tail sheath gpL-like